jgi:hypothetical protein
MFFILQGHGIFIQTQWLERGGSSYEILNHTEDRIKI